MKASAVAGAVAAVVLCAALGGLAVRANQAQGEATAAAERPVLTISPVGDGGIQICWDPIEGARCRVLRAAEASGPYEPVSDWLSEPGFVDADAPAGGAFYRLEIEENAGLDLLPTDGDPPAPSAAELAATIAFPPRRGSSPGSRGHGRGLPRRASRARPRSAVDPVPVRPSDSEPSGMATRLAADSGSCRPVFG